MYQPYADRKFYQEVYQGNTINEENIDKSLKKASRHVDTLTFNRIVGVFTKLTEFQKEIIQEVTCSLADFEFENKELIESVLSSYSINGVSMNIGNSWNIKVINGVAIPYDLYNQLAQSGLTCRSFYY